MEIALLALAEAVEIEQQHVEAVLAQEARVAVAQEEALGFAAHRVRKQHITDRRRTQRGPEQGSETGPRAAGDPQRLPVLRLLGRGKHPRLAEFAEERRL